MSIKKGVQLIMLVLALTGGAALHGSGRVECFVRMLDRLRRDCRIPGLSGAVISGSRLLWKGGLGEADPRRATAADASTRYHIASLTKTMSALCAMRLIEAGKLSLGTGVSSVVSNPEHYRGVQLRHLLSHTAGAQGEAFRYQSRNYALVGRLLEKESGQSVAGLLRDKLFRPLGMDDTRMEGIYDGQGNTLISNLAPPFQYVQGRWVAGKLKHRNATAAYGIVSTVDDLLRYVQSLLPGGRFARLVRRQFVPVRSTSGAPLPYGFGWFCASWHGEPFYWHYGWRVEGYSSLIVLLPRLRSALILLANSDGLSAPFSLGRGRSELSPFAVEFLRRFTKPVGASLYEWDLGTGLLQLQVQVQQQMKERLNPPAAWYCRLAGEALLARRQKRSLRSEQLMAAALQRRTVLYKSYAVLAYCSVSQRYDLRRYAEKIGTELIRHNPADLRPLYYLGLMGVRSSGEGAFRQGVHRLETAAVSKGYLPGYMRCLAAAVAGEQLLERDPERAIRLLQIAAGCNKQVTRVVERGRKLLKMLRPLGGVLPFILKQ